jgi:glutaredoxin
MSPITLYTSEDCPHCRTMENLLKRMGLQDYEKVSISDDDGMKRFVQACPDAPGVPQIVVNGQWRPDLTLDVVNRLLKAGAPDLLLRGVAHESAPRALASRHPEGPTGEVVSEDPDREIQQRLQALDQNEVDRLEQTGREIRAQVEADPTAENLQAENENHGKLVRAQVDAGRRASGVRAAREAEMAPGAMAATAPEVSAEQEASRERGQPGGPSGRPAPEADAPTPSGRTGTDEPPASSREPEAPGAGREAGAAKKPGFLQRCLQAIVRLYEKVRSWVTGEPPPSEQALVPGAGMEQEPGAPGSRPPSRSRTMEREGPVERQGPASSPQVCRPGQACHARSR